MVKGSEKSENFVKKFSSVAEADACFFEVIHDYIAKHSVQTRPLPNLKVIENRVQGASRFYTCANREDGSICFHVSLMCIS